MTIQTEEKEKTQSKPFVHLHLHSEYSLLDGAVRITKGKKSPLLSACQQKQMQGCAVTDHGLMFGAFTFYKKARDYGIKPIIGCEFYTCENMYEQTTERFHLILLAKTTEGYRNIVKMDSLAYTDGFYYKPRIDMKLLRQYSKGVICLSACLSSKFDKLLVAGNYEGAKAYAIEMRDMFEQGDYYIELQDHGIAEQRKINPLKVKIAKEIGVKVVATNDVHYIERKDSEMQEILMCIATGKNYDDPTRIKFDSDEFYLKDYDEMMELFDWCPEAVTNTIEVLDKCNIEIKKEDLMPPYNPENGSTPTEYLRHLAYEGLLDRYGEITPEIKERADYELDVIIRMGFAEYYLIVWDFINYAHRQGIPVGDGRGSGVGSIIAYAVRITNVDPLRFNLLFERFLNPERVSAPDFDIDFCMDRRGEVIDYVIKKYGKEKVCQILALGTMKAKGAIKDVARVYRIPLDIVNKTTKSIPNTPGITLDKILGRTGKEEDLAMQNVEVMQIYEENPDMRKVIDMALQVEGMPRNCSKHAAGVVICKEIISDFVPLQRNGEDVTTQFQKEEVEELGMLKMDFLGLTTLTDISKACLYIKENYGREIDFDKLSIDDPEVYKMLSSGDCATVFQLESEGMKNFMKQLQPTNIEDVIAGISLYRPGPMDSIPKFIEAKKNPQKISYKTKLLEPILKMTYGFFVYQEQVMQAVQTVAGYTLGRADILRRAMGKKKADVMRAEKQIFIHGCDAKPAQYYSDGTLKSEAEPAVDGAIKRGVTQENASAIFDEMQDFAKYAFNKSHAAAYSMLTYKTAYLKHYYFTELVTAIINNRITKADEIAKYLTFAKESGCKLLPPDINYSNVNFSASTNNEIRFGLNGIKNIGAEAMRLLVEERNKNGKYKSISEILCRLPSNTLTKRCFETLIKAGAFDCFGHNRATLMANYECLIMRSIHEKKMHLNGQMSLFGLLENDSCEIGENLNVMKEFSRSDLLLAEKEVLNIYMSGHPLEEYTNAYKTMSFDLQKIKPLLEKPNEDDMAESELIDDQNDRLVSQYHDKVVELGGILKNFKKTTTKNGKLMAYGAIEDLYGTIEVVFFPTVLEKYKNLLNDDCILKVIGRLNLINDRGVSMPIMSVQNWTLTQEQQAQNAIIDSQEPKDNQSHDSDGKKVYIRIGDMQQYKLVNGLCDTHQGNNSVFIQFNQNLYEHEIKINLTNIFIMRLNALVGEENVKIK